MLSNKSQYILSKIGIPLFEDAKNPTKNDEINIYFFQKDNILTLHPEACASIVWRESEKAPEAAEAMKVGAKDLKNIGIVDEIIVEPIGGAHQDYDAVSANIKSSLLTNIAELSKFSQEELLQRRYQRLLKIGA